MHSKLQAGIWRYSNKSWSDKKSLEDPNRKWAGIQCFGYVEGSWRNIWNQAGWRDFYSHFARIVNDGKHQYSEVWCFFTPSKCVLYELWWCRINAIKLKGYFKCFCRSWKSFPECFFHFNNFPFSSMIKEIKERNLSMNKEMKVSQIYCYLKNDDGSAMELVQVSFSR